MAITKTKTGKWLLYIRPGGRSGKQIRKTFQTKGEAKEFEIWHKSQSKNPEWVFRKDKRKLSDLFEVWFQNHGQFLKSGADTIARIKTFAVEIGNPPICELSPDHFTAWRSEQIQVGLAENTCNRIHAYCKSAINELIRTNVIQVTNPFSSIKLLKIDENELSFLSADQTNKILRTLKNDARNKHVYLIAKICLSSGARWSEGEGLRITQLQGNLIQYARTKSSKARGVPISAELAVEIRNHHESHGVDAQVFGRAYNAFREGIARAGIELPDGQMTHVLRHTFASHFIQHGGNILTLQRILGHHTLAMTMRYAHLAPDHLSDALRLNPLANLTEFHT